MFLLVQQMSRRFQEVLTPHDLTPLHWGILSCLWKQDGLRTTEIVQQLEQLGGTITVGLDAMQKRGLIRRKVNPADRRVSQIFLTAKAKNLQPILEPQARALIADTFSILTEQEFATLASQVATLRRHLSATRTAD
jgi:DNA-binding MarR family transcriptional regulator